MRADIEITSIKSTVMESMTLRSVYKHLLLSKIRKKTNVVKEPIKKGLIITQGMFQLLYYTGNSMQFLQVPPESLTQEKFYSSLLLLTK